MTTKIEIITSASALDKLSVELSRDIKGMDDRIQQYLLSEVAHIEEHRNITRLNQFLSAIKGSGQRVNAMHNFVQVFGNVTFLDSPVEGKNADGSTYTIFYRMKAVRKHYRAHIKGTWKKFQNFGELLDAAMAEPWYKFQPERPARAFDFDGKVKAFLRGIIQAIDADKDGTQVDRQKAAALFDMATSQLGYKVEDFMPANLELPAEMQKTLHLEVANDDAPKAKANERKRPAGATA